MNDAEVLIVFAGATVLILASSLRRRRRYRADYWLPDGNRIRRPKAE